MLASAATVGAGSLAGCLGDVLPGQSPSGDGNESTATDGETDGTEDTDSDGTEEPTYGEDDPPELPTVEDPPPVVYVPSHREGMEMLEPQTAGDYELRPMLSYAHPFWTVTGGNVEPVEVGPADDVHLMVAVRDAETGTVLPADDGLTLTVREDGELVDSRSPWQMLSQTMGFHFGDNVPLFGDGEYEVTVELPPLDLRKAGTLEGRFESTETASFSFTYDQALRDRLIEGIDYVDEEERGVPGAIEPMGDGGALPPAEDLPGTLQRRSAGESGEEDGDGASDGDGDDGSDTDANGDELPRSHDADVAITTGADGFGEDPYLLVSPRTPYNRAPLVGAALTTTVRRDGAEVDSAALHPVVDDRAGFHYGNSIPDLQPGDDVTVAFDARPSVARHQGYETAFLQMDPVEVTLEGW